MGRINIEAVLENDSSHVLYPSELRGYGINELRELYKNLSDRNKKTQKLLIKKTMELKPFVFDTEFYVFYQGEDVFESNREKILALRALSEAEKWGNEDYQKKLAECSKIRELYSIQEVNIQRLKERIVLLKNKKL